MVPWHFGQVSSMSAQRTSRAASSHSAQWMPQVGAAQVGMDTGTPRSPDRWELVLDKVVATTREAVADISDGATLAVGGFGLCGVPFALIDALLEQGTAELTTISNNCGVDDAALGVLLYAGRIRKTIRDRKSGV